MLVTYCRSSRRSRRPPEPLPERTRPLSHPRELRDPPRPPGAGPGRRAAASWRAAECGGLPVRSDGMRVLAACRQLRQPPSTPGAGQPLIRVRLPPQADDRGIRVRLPARFQEHGRVHPPVPGLGAPEAAEGEEDILTDMAGCRQEGHRCSSSCRCAGQANTTGSRHAFCQAPPCCCWIRLPSPARHCGQYRVAEVNTHGLASARGTTSLGTNTASRSRVDLLAS